MFDISARIPCPHPGRIWLEQRGLQRALYWHIEARVVLDLQEFSNLVSLSKLNPIFGFLMLLFVSRCSLVQLAPLHPSLNPSW